MNDLVDNTIAYPSLFTDEENYVEKEKEIETPWFPKSNGKAKPFPDARTLYLFTGVAQLGILKSQRKDNIL